jgi:hypothetical protein
LTWLYISMAIPLTQYKVQSIFNMAEEAMSFIASKHFNFSEEGDYIPYNNPSRAPDRLLNTAPLNHPITHQKLVLYPDGLYSHDDDDLYGETQPGDPDHGFNLYQWVESGQPLLDGERSPTPLEELFSDEYRKRAQNMKSQAPGQRLPPAHQLAHSQRTVPPEQATLPQQFAPIQDIAPSQHAGPAQHIVPAQAGTLVAAVPRAALPGSTPVTGGGGLASNSHTVGLSLVRNGKTFPKIEGGRERWYSQRPGHGNSYSRYSDLVSHDKAKGLTPLPKASKAELETTRRQQTFG